MADSDSETLSSRSLAARGDVTSGQPAVLGQSSAELGRGSSLREASSSGASTLVDIVVENPLVNSIATVRILYLDCTLNLTRVE